MIRLISKQELNFAHKLTEIEEWGTTIEELEDLFLFSPKGFFVSEVDGELNGIVSTTFYGTFGVIGNLIVLKDFRRQGFGSDLMKHAITYLKSKGTKTLFLDAVPQISSLYEKLGFQTVCRSLRLEGKVTKNRVPNARRMTSHDIPNVIKLDKKHFGGNRAFLLKRRFSIHPELCYVLVRKEKLKGFIMGVPKKGFILIGPWIVDPKEPEPLQLLQSLFNSVNINLVRLGILENKKKAVELTRNLDFREYFYSIRMRYGRSFSHSDGLFAIAGPDRG